MANRYMKRKLLSYSMSMSIIVSGEHRNKDFSWMPVTSIQRISLWGENNFDIQLVERKDTEIHENWFSVGKYSWWWRNKVYNFLLEFKKSWEVAVGWFTPHFNSMCKMRKCQGRIEVAESCFVTLWLSVVFLENFNTARNFGFYYFSMIMSFQMIINNAPHLELYGGDSK